MTETICKKDCKFHSKECSARVGSKISDEETSNGSDDLPDKSALERVWNMPVKNEDRRRAKMDAMRKEVVDSKPWKPNFFVCWIVAYIAVNIVWVVLINQAPGQFAMVFIFHVIDPVAQAISLAVAFGIQRSLAAASKGL